MDESRPSTNKHWLAALLLALASAAIFVLDREGIARVSVEAEGGGPPERGVFLDRWPHGGR